MADDGQTALIICVMRKTQIRPLVDKKYIPFVIAPANIYGVKYYSVHLGNDTINCSMFCGNNFAVAQKTGTKLCEATKDKYGEASNEPKRQ